MLTLGAPRVGLVVAATLVGAAASGAIIGQSSARGLLLVGAFAFVALAVVTFEAPILVFAGLAFVLGIASEAGRDDRLFNVTEFVYRPVVSVFNPPLIVLGLLGVVLALNLNLADRWWAGAPATIALALLTVGVASAVWFGPLVESLFVLYPVVVLVVATLVGYWMSLRYGTEALLKALVVAAMLAIPGGLYNIAAGDISYYDASFVYLIGVAGILVLFRVVEVGLIRMPFLVLSVLVIVLSLRRGAMIGVAIAFLITGIVSGRGTFRTVVVLIAGAVVAVELFVPGLVVSKVEHVVGYFSGASGQDFSVNYRRYETANAWVNVKHHWVGGIGLTTDWTVYRTFEGKFVPETIGENTDYLHNSYLWVWLRYGLLGVILYAALFAVSAASLIRRSAPTVAVVVGGSMAGLAVAHLTASWLTTTLRWPMIVGFYLGIAMAAWRQTPAPVGRSADDLLGRERLSSADRLQTLASR